MKHNKQRKRVRIFYKVKTFFSIGFGCCFFIGCLSVFTPRALATSPLVMPVQLTHPHAVDATIQSTDLKDRANAWHLTATEFKRYVWLITHTPSGQWYRHLDPAEVLALNSKDPQDMLHYAKIQARNMHLRVTRELAFDKLYAKAYHLLYPHEKAIQTPIQSKGLNAVLRTGDHVWLFVGLHTPLGAFVYHHLIALIEPTAHTVLDIYFVGRNVSTHGIQAWALANHLPRHYVNHRVTLNYSNGRFNAIKKNKPVTLPLVGIVHRGRFQPITLSSVL